MKSKSANTRNYISQHVREQLIRTAKEYSLVAESELMQQIPVALRNSWRGEIEKHFINGMVHMLNDPSGGVLMYVKQKAYKLGYQEGYADAIDEKLK